MADLLAYATIEDLRDFGILGDVLDDDRAKEFLASASYLIEKHTAQWFTPKIATLTVDHSEGRMVYLPTFLISTTPTEENPELGVYNYGSLIDPTEYKIYNSVPVDWDNPRIRFNNKLNMGYDNKGDFLDIIGQWGVVDANGATPTNINLATLQIVAEMLEHDTNDGLPASLRDFIQSEQTDRHQYTVSSERFKQMTQNFIPLQTQLLLEPFMAPIQV